MRETTQSSAYLAMECKVFDVFYGSKLCDGAIVGLLWHGILLDLLIQLMSDILQIQQHGVVVHGTLCHSHVQRLLWVIRQHMKCTLEAGVKLSIAVPSRRSM